MVKYIIIFDFEVFMYNVMLGIYIVDNNDRSKKELFQTWDKEEIKKLYFHFKDAIWVGHNNKFYDNHILEAILFDKDPYERSRDIIDRGLRKNNVAMEFNSFDLNQQVMVALKQTEAYWGKKIHMSDIPFDIDRPLNEKEIEETNEYNKSDLDQTYDNFIALQNSLDLRLALINEFKLDNKYLDESISNISSVCLGVKRKKVAPLEKPYLFSQLKIANEDLLEWYQNRDYREKKFSLKINGVVHDLGVGGIHGAKKKYEGKETKDKTIWYFDVSGYYNLLMIKYNLFSRSMSEEAKENYEKLYYQQLALKGKDPIKREVYKIILLAVFGATRNEYTSFYDPDHFEMITLNGQLFLVDLLEKLEPHIDLVQTNTDGIIFEALNKDKEVIQSIIKEWEDRTQFTLKGSTIKKLFQRDVNNYLMEEANGDVTTRGEALKYATSYNEPTYRGVSGYSPKEPLIISILMKEALLRGSLPEDEINKWKDELRLFQFICKKGTYGKLIYRTTKGDEDILPISRAFPSLNKDDGTIIKVKGERSAKVANLPPNVIIHNDEILNDKIKKELTKQIDWQWYVDRVYERLNDFL